MQKKKKNNILEIVKAARKQSRQEEISQHGKPVRFSKIVTSKKIYSRKNNKFEY
ncbi:hypothetical protein SDC9_203631 [bioreactor metagenome]|uniref:Uncharacterized protein n=1 Tax=bioreactor metagenome TaxID=1076179 RepID=A0A645IXS6_9ZZZZ